MAYFLRRFILAFALFFLAAVSPFAAAADLPDAAELLRRIDAGEHRAVFAELTPLESEFTGIPEYDYLFGVAAARSGEVYLGIFALERALAASPRHIGAAMELAQTDIALGNPAQGLAKLRALIARNDVPDKIKAQAAALIAAVGEAAHRRALAARDFGWHGEVRGGVGYADNAVYRSDDDFYDISLSDTVVLEDVPAGKRPGAAYSESAASLEWRIPTGRKTSPRFTLGARVFSRAYDSKDDADRSNYRAGGPYISAVAQTGKTRYNARVFAERVATENNWRHDIIGASLSALRPLNPRFALRGALGYQLLEARRDDPDKSSPSLALAAIYAPDDKTAVHAVAGFASERRKKTTGDGDKKISLSATAAIVRQAVFGKPATGTLIASYRRARYNRDNPAFFHTRRKDRTLTAAAELEWRIGQTGLSIAPQASYTRTRSNIAAYAYTRREGIVSLRYKF